MDDKLLGVIVFFVAMNVVAFCIMLWDKMQSKKKGANRISEGFLFFMATIFGSIGVYMGMFMFRHKTRKWYFIIGIPFLIVQNCTFLYIVYLFAKGDLAL